MRLELLGSGRLISDSGEALLRSGLPLALLAYLRRAGGPVAREHLAALFWPGRPRPLALQSLRQALRRLRATCGEDVVTTEGRQVSLGKGALGSCDLEDLVERVREGDAEGALALWQGTFLEDFRLPQSWEVEDWLERERSGLSAMVLACISGEVEARLAGGEVEGAEVEGALALLAEARPRFPYREDLARWAFDALLLTGRAAEAAGILEELRVAGDVDDLEELETRLAATPRRAPGTGVRNGAGSGTLPGSPTGPGSPAQSGAPPTPSDAPLATPAPSPSTPSSPPRDPSHLHSLAPPGAPARLPRRRLAVALGLVMVGAAVAGGWWWTHHDLLDGIAEGLRDWNVLYCHEAATEGRFQQPARMDFDGRSKHRISPLHACHLLWVQGPGMLLAVEFPGEEREDYRLVRLVPHPDNPIAEWEDRSLLSLAGLSSVQLTLFGDVVLDGRHVPVTAVDGSGVRNLYLLDVEADTLRQLTRGPGSVRYPTFDLRRREVIVSLEREGPAWDLWALGLDDPAAAPVRLTESPSEDSRPSVHGDRILFSRGWGEGPTEGDLEIRLLDRGSGREEVLVSNPWNEYQAAWSPDGRHICWQSDEFGHFESDIHVMEMATRRQWSVTRRVEGRSSGCHWTPDGRGLLYHGTVGGVTQTILTDLRGRRHRNLSRDGFLSAPAGYMPAR